MTNKQFSRDRLIEQGKEGKLEPHELVEFPVTPPPCTCHPDDNPPVPCPQKYSLSECRAAAAQPDESKALATVLKEQEVLIHPATQVFFRVGLLACREYMARFVQHESPTIAASIRANWWPVLGQDFGAPRQLQWGEMTEGEFGEEGFRAKTADEISPTQEALPVALQFLQSLDPAYGRVTIGTEGLERSIADGCAAPSPKAPAVEAGAVAFNPDNLDFEPDEYHAVADMANIGKALLDQIAIAMPGYNWMESPVEIVCDLINQRDEISDDILRWAVERWKAEVSNRPLVNVHRRSLDDTWRQIVKHLGGNVAHLLGPSHSELLAAVPPAASAQKGITNETPKCPEGGFCTGNCNHCRT